LPISIGWKNSLAPSAVNSYRHYMSGPSDISAKIRNWLTTEGYPLEMRSAAIFREAGFEVRQGQHYIDPDTGKSREIDLRCVDEDARGLSDFQLVVECKMSGKPWVVFTSPHVLEGYNRFFSYAFLSDEARKALTDLHVRGDTNAMKQLSWFGKSGRIGYAATVALSDKGTDTAYTATMSVLKAALWHRQDDYAAPLAVTFPVLVVDAPLCECYLDENGEMQLIQVDSCELAFAGRIGDQWPGACIRIVSAAALPTFARQARTEIDTLKALLVPAMERAWEELRRGQRESSGRGTDAKRREGQF